MLYLLILLLFAALVVAFMARGTWSFTLPGLLLLVLIFYLLFAS